MITKPGSQIHKSGARADVDARAGAGISEVHEERPRVGRMAPDPGAEGKGFDMRFASTCRGVPKKDPVISVRCRLAPCRRSDTQGD